MHRRTGSQPNIDREAALHISKPTKILKKSSSFVLTTKPQSFFELRNKNLRGIDSGNTTTDVPATERRKSKVLHENIL